MEPSLSPETPEIPRRRYSREFKRQVVQESFAAGASIARVAQSHGINANLLHTWRWQFRREVQDGAGELARLIPVELSTSTAPGSAPLVGDTGQIEVTLGEARVVVRGTVSEAALRSVFRALRP